MRIFNSCFVLVVMLCVCIMMSNFAEAKDRWHELPEGLEYSSSGDKVYSYLDTDTIEYDEDKRTVKFWLKVVIADNGYGKSTTRLNRILVDLDRKKYCATKSVDPSGYYPKVDVNSNLSYFDIYPEDDIELAVDYISETYGIRRMTMPSDKRWIWLASSDKATFLIGLDTIKVDKEKGTLEFWTKKVYPDGKKTPTLWKCYYNGEYVEEINSLGIYTWHIIPDSFAETVYNTAKQYYR